MVPGWQNSGSRVSLEIAAGGMFLHTRTHTYTHPHIDTLKFAV